MGVPLRLSLSKNLKRNQILEREFFRLQTYEVIVSLAKAQVESTDHDDGPSKLLLKGI